MRSKKDAIFSNEFMAAHAQKLELELLRIALCFCYALKSVYKHTIEAYFIIGKVLYYF